MAATEYAAPFAASTIATSQQFRRRNRPGSPDGVDADYGAGDLAVTVSGGGASIDIANGRHIVQGALYELSGGPLTLAVGANGAGSNRYDVAVLTYDSAHTPGIYARVITGSTSAFPALTNSESGVWDEPIAAWEKTPAGAITNLVDRRFFLDNSGGLVGRAVTAVSGLSGTQYFPPAPRRGQRVSLANSSGLIVSEWRWSGTFWERIDPAPLLDLSSATAGEINTNSWAATLSGAPSLTGSFTAPMSGRVNVTLTALLGSGDYNAYVRAHVSGPGVTDAPTAGHKLVRGGGFGSDGVWSTGHTRYPLSGLTPGSSYTATMQYLRDATGTPNNNINVPARHLMIERG